MKTSLKFVGVLFVVYFVACLSSQTAMDVVSAIVFVTSAVLFFKNKDKFSDLKLGPEKLFLALSIAMALSFIFGATESPPWVSRIFELKWILILYASVYLSRYYKFEVKFFKICSYFLATASVYAIVVYFLEFDPIGGQSKVENLAWRTGGLLGNSMTFGHLYGLVTCCFLGLSINQLAEKKYEQKVIFLATALCGLATVFSLARGVWLGFVFVIPLMCWLLLNRKLFWYSILGILIGFMALILSWQTFLNRILYSFKSNDSDGTRIYLWRANLKIFQDFPIFGAGYGENKRLLPEYFERLNIPPETLVSHAHNQYLHILAGTGVVGLIAYLAVFIWLFVFNIKVWKSYAKTEGWEKGLCAGILGAQVLLWIGGLTEANFEHSKIRYTMIFIWTLLFILHRKNSKNTVNDLRTKHG